MSSFEHCKYEFYLNYTINDDDLYLSEGNYYAEEGSFVHEILAMVFKRELDVENALQYYIDHHDENVCYRVRQSIMDKNFEKIADYFATIDLKWLEDYEVLGVELEQKFKVNDYEFIGYIDLLLRDKRDGKIVVLDHKSAEYPINKKNGKVKKNSEKSFESYKKQMYLYCHAIHQAFGEFPKEITWNYFKESQLVTIPFNKSEYEDTIKWLVDTINEAEHEEDYEPSEEFFYCSTLCGFRGSCEYHKATKGN